MGLIISLITFTGGSFVGLDRDQHLVARNQGANSKSLDVVLLYCFLVPVDFLNLVVVHLAPEDEVIFCSQ
jgi:hypothetical protein